jgi:hypothetical protein
MTRSSARQPGSGAARRRARRACVALGATAAGLVAGAAAATPAFAEAAGRAGGAGVGFGEIVLTYVVAPLALFAVIGALAVLPSARRRPQYRPGRPFSGEPVWFAGPDDPETAVRNASPGDQHRGGARGSW